MINLSQQQIWNLYKEFSKMNLNNNMQNNNNFGINNMNNNMNNNPMSNSMNNINNNMKMSNININNNLSNSFNNVSINNNFGMNMNTNMNNNFCMMNNWQMNNNMNNLNNLKMNNNMNNCMMNNIQMNNCMNNMCLNNNMMMNKNNFNNNLNMNNNMNNCMMMNNCMNNCMMMNNCMNNCMMNNPKMNNCLNNCLMNNGINGNNMNNNFNNTNSEIRIKFSFMTCQVFNVKGYSNEKFSELLKRFENNECPKELKKHLSIPLFFGNKITNTNKTLSELGITNNSVILFIISNKEEAKKIENKEKKEHKLTEDERIQLKKWQEEYEAKKLIQRALNHKNKGTNDERISIQSDDGETINNFLEFVKNKEQRGAITVKEHNHKLVYCLTDFNWNCNICKKNYKKNKARYLCSICNYNMCEECHSKGQYIKKKVFPDGITPSNTSVNKKFFQTDYHEHQLVYCRSSRSVIGYNGWICDNCRDNFENEIWSFLCTNCDFDLCCSCAGYN
jgi:hypothetical protein